MNLVTRCFLVILRLAIGWHLFIEGWHKLESLDPEPGAGRPAFSAEHYLRDVSGPLSDFFRELGGTDPDDLAIQRLTADPGANEKPEPHFPSALKKEWDAYHQAFLAHYQLTNDSSYKESLLKVQAEEEKRTVDWLLHGVAEVPVRERSNVETVRRTTPQRIEAYRAKLREVRDAQREGNPAWGREFWQRLAAAKAERDEMRIALLSDLNRHTARFKRALAEHVMTKSLNEYRSQVEFWNREYSRQLAVGPIFLASPVPFQFPDPSRFAKELLYANPEFWKKGAMSDPPEPRNEFAFGMTSLEWINLLTAWGLTVVGICLILGIFTRTMCVAGAMFMLMFFLSNFPLMDLAGNPRAEGYYLLVNKNLIEMFALLVLATTRSGYWLGFDRLIAFLNPYYWFLKIRRKKEKGKSQKQEAAKAIIGDARTMFC